MNEKDLKPIYIKYKNKSIVLVPNTHFGQQEFYNNLKDSISRWKSYGYRIYYEQVKSSTENMQVDSIKRDSLFRKWRHITGRATGSRESYNELGKTFKNRMVQPEWKDLGITDSDLNADVTLQSIIEKYEEKYELIKLNECDKNIHLDSTYNCYNKTNNDLSPIIYDFRNNKLIEFIDKNEDKKIVVIYGAGHMNGILKLLKYE